MDYKQRISEYSAADAEIQGGIYLYLAYGLYDAAVAAVYVIIGQPFVEAVYLGRSPELHAEVEHKSYALLWHGTSETYAEIRLER